MPKMSDTMEEGVIAAWLVKEGDEVAAGDVLAEVETDKATMELESYEEGTILHIAIQEKEAVPVDGLIAIVGEKGEDYKALLAEAGQENDASERAAEPAAQAEGEAEAAIPEGVVILRMPKMSDTMEEGVIADWLVKIGDKVSSGDVLAEVETDKATMELESYDDGTVLHIAVEAGGAVPIDGVIAILGEEGTDISAVLKAEENKGGAKGKAEKKTEEAKAEVAPTPGPRAEQKAEVEAAPAQAAPAQAAPAQAAPAQASSNRQSADGSRIFASPLAKKIAAEKGISLADVKGTGENGRVVKRDIENFDPAQVAKAAPAVQAPATAAQPAPADAAAQVRPFTAAGQESYTEQPLSQMRKTIARRLSESKFTAPHFYLTMEINMDKAMEARGKMNELSPVKLSFNDLVIKAAAVALQQHPTVNSSWLGDKIRINEHVHVGMAVAVDEGLLVPVIRFANQKTLSQISAEAKELGGKARSKKLQPAEWEGSTFTISNLGMFGIEEFTAIINPPDACIMAVGGIKQTAIVKDGQLVPGNVMKVTLSCDHRAVDGASGAAFLNTFKQLLEEPVRLLI